MDVGGKPPIAREYLRVSRDRSGRQRSTTEQQDDNRSRWTDLEFGEPYSDVSVSASRFTTKARGGYNDLVGDLEAGRFSAEVLVLWESSRGSRRVGEWVTLIELCEDQGVQIAVTTDGRMYDPANPRDRRSLIEDASDAEYESAKVSMRARRAQAANAAAGRPNGPIPFGYRRRYDEHSGRLAAQEPEPAEAVLVVELFDRIVAGHSFRAIAKDWTERGIRTPARISRGGQPMGGVPWTPQHLRAVAQRRLYVGERVHRGETFPAAWPAIIDRSRWLATQAILGDPNRKVSRPGRAVHLLSMIAKCDVCGGPLSATNRPTSGRRGRPRKPQYQCHSRGCVRVDKPELDDLVEEVILRFLSRPDHVERLTADVGDDDRLQAARLDVQKIRAELDDLADRVGRGELSATLAARAEPRVLARLHQAEAREQELSTPSRLRDLMTPGQDIDTRWVAAPMSAKREIARMLLVPDVLGELRIERSPTPGKPCPVQDRLVWRT